MEELGEAPSVMTPLLPCHGPFFTAAAATWVTLRYSNEDRRYRVMHGNAYFVVQLESPVTEASTLVPSMYLPVLYLFVRSVSIRLADDTRHDEEHT